MPNSTIEEYWAAFLGTLQDDSTCHVKTYVAEPFGDTPELANELGRLVLNGVKTGTCSALWEWEAEGNPIPEVGAISITLDGAGSPICILESTEITIRRFDEVDEDFARSEGEGDLSLRHWREAHRDFFSRVLPKFGREFSEQMPLVCERFKLIYK
jgi:uncharacterized protein YhfF